MDDRYVAHCVCGKTIHTKGPRVLCPDCKREGVIQWKAEKDLYRESTAFFRRSSRRHVKDQADALSRLSSARLVALLGEMDHARERIAAQLEQTRKAEEQAAVKEAVARVQRRVA